MGTAINPLCASCCRAKALGYARRSPPARAMTDSFFKVHQPSAMRGDARLRGRESCALLQKRERHHLRCARLRRAPRQRRSSPAGASTHSGRASLPRTSGVTPTTDDIGLLLSQTEIHFSRRETSIMVIAVIHCSFPVHAGCHRARASRPVWGDQERDPCPPYGSHRCVQARRPRSQAVQGRVLLWRARNMPERPWAALAGRHPDRPGFDLNRLADPACAGTLWYNAQSWSVSQHRRKV